MDVNAGPRVEFYLIGHFELDRLSKKNFMNLILFLSGFSLTHVDEVIDELLTKDYSCDIALPRVKKRYRTDYSCDYFPVSLFFKWKLIMSY